MKDDERLAQLARLNRNFAAVVPHNKALGIRLKDLAEAEAWMELPWREDLVGNPETGILHGGVITALLDACCGTAVFMALPEPMPIATLDLRIDYLRPASTGRTVVAHAQCYRVTRHVAFVRCVAFHDDESVLIATATGTFMLSTRAESWKSPDPSPGEAV